MLNSVEYWTEYYKKSGQRKNHSHFCEWFSKTYRSILSKEFVVDLCCGDGLDTNFFSNYSMGAVGVDAACRPSSTEHTRFVKSSISDYMNNNSSPGMVYSRFGFHAIEQSESDLILEWTSKYLVAEMRSDIDPVPDHSHKRRNINARKLFRDLSFFGFRLIHFSESRGHAVYKDEDPMIIRVVAIKEEEE